MTSIFSFHKQENSDGESQMTRAIVALEMFVVSKNGIMEFKDVPNIGEVSVVKIYMLSCLIVLLIC